MRFLGDFLDGLSFLTVIPVGTSSFPPPYTFPLVGLAIGALLSLSCFLLGGLLDPLLLAFILVSLSSAVTGFLHVDGLLDSFDALFIRDRNKALSVMKDSRSGALGAASVSLLIVGKFSSFAHIAYIKKPAFIIPAYVVSRWSPVFLSFFFPPAKDEGLGYVMGESARGNPFSVFAATAITALFLFLFGRVILLFLVFVPLIFLFGLFWKNKLGGITGDVLGCSVELTELFFLFFVPLLYGR